MSRVLTAGRSVRALHCLALLNCLTTGSVLLSAQDLPAPDARSGQIALVSRTLWRSMTLTDAISFNTQVALPLFGAPGLLNGVQLEGRSWNALEDRTRFRYADQYALTARYLKRIGSSTRAQYVSLGYTEYVNPNLPSGTGALDKWNGEVGLGVALETGFPTLGIPSVHFYGEVARELQRSEATYARVTASHTVGAGALSATATLSVSASDYPSRLLVAQQPSQDFGFHSVDGELAVGYTWPRSRLSSYATVTSLMLGGSLRAERLGPKVGWIGVRQFIQVF